MLRINQTEPLWIPGVSRLFGPFRFDNFFGKLSGHTQFPQGPYMYGQKFSFKPFAEIEVGTHNKIRPFKGIEIGFSRTVVFAGQNHVPLTFGSFWNSFTSFGDCSSRNQVLTQRSGRAVWLFRFLLEAGELGDYLHRLADA